MEALKEHFKNSKFPCEMEHYLPVVFAPPRDGRQLSEPLPIVGQKQQQQLPSNPTDHPLENGNESEEYAVSCGSGSCNSSSSVNDGYGDNEDEKDGNSVVACKKVMWL